MHRIGFGLVALSAALATFAPANAGEPKSGGILKIYHRETPGGISIHEEATFSTNVPMMGVFNNLVMYDQHKEQNSMDTIVPELATSWAWNADKTQLTFKLREGVKWHDGKPFTAKDVKCTWDMLAGKSAEKFRINPRKARYRYPEGRVDDGDKDAPPMRSLRWPLSALPRSPSRPMSPPAARGPIKLPNLTGGRFRRVSSPGTAG